MTSDELFDLLDSLGGSSSVVASRLLAEGCRGRRHDACHCPLVAFVRRHVGPGTWVAAGPNVMNVTWFSTGEHASTAYPPAVAEFIKRFDAREFPDLDTLSE
jgi:hypothetical protein